jgi:diguanylate cyclase (GGDEF)-like protein
VGLPIRTQIMWGHLSESGGSTSDRNHAGTVRPEPSSALAADQIDDAGLLPARSLGYLYLAGATIGLVSLILPHAARADLPGLYSNVALAYLGALGLLLGARRVRPWMLQALMACGTLLVTRAILLSGEAVSFYSVWYIWIGLYAFYFLGRRAAAAHVGWVAVLYALTLINDPPSSPVARWLTTMATLIVAGVFIDTLLRRARQQAHVAEASASSMARVTAVAHELAGLSESAAGRTAICRGAVRITQADYGALWEPGAGSDDLRLTAQDGQRPDGSVLGAIGSPGLEAAFGTARTVTEDGSVDDPAVTTVWQPVVHEARTVAVLELAWRRDRFTPDPAGAALINLFAVEVAVTLQRLGLLAELEAKARTDELTGLPNRRWWDEQLPRELTRAARREEPLSVAIIDLDHFKLYNDTFGHPTGDVLLQTVAKAWSLELRPSDMLARHGGEEFVLALPGCPLDEALAVVERLRAAMPEGQSCSAGIACWDGTETVTELLDRADHALYEAKRNGRDQSALAAPPAGATA